MIRALLPDRDGNQTVLLGLDRANVDRLTAGQPIRVDLAELQAAAATAGGPITVVTIAFGETQAALLADLRAAGLPVPRVHGVDA